MKKLLSMTLEQIYLDYVNDFSMKYMAEYYGVSYEFMNGLVSMGRELYEKVYEGKEL